MLTSKKQTGFTIVELLIVIVVIGILAAITIVAYNGVQERARVSKANSDLSTLAKAIRVGRLAQDKTLAQITGSNCTRCGDQGLYERSLDRIGAASGANLSGLKVGDPWGEAYSIDENEGEQVATPCRIDVISTRTSHAGVSFIHIPLYSCSN